MKLIRNQHFRRCTTCCVLQHFIVLALCCGYAQF